MITGNNSVTKIDEGQYFIFVNGKNIGGIKLLENSGTYYIQLKRDKII